MPDSRTINRKRLAGEILACSAICGFADAAAIVFKLFESRDLVDYVPGSIWLWCVGLWLLLGGLASVAIALAPKRWTPRLTAAVLAGEFWVLVAIRAGRPLSAQYGVRRTTTAVVIIAAWFLTTRLLRIGYVKKRERSSLRSGLRFAVPVIVGLAFLLQFTEASGAQAEVTKPRRGGSGPNIVLIFLDTLRADTATQMPNLQRFMRRGAVFTNAIAPAPWTLPSHFSAITGESAVETGITFAKQRYETDDTLPLLLQHRGYETAGVVANFFLNSGSGFDRGFERYEMPGRALDLCRAAPLMIANRYWPSLQHNVCGATATTIITRAKRVMSARHAPLFLLLNFTDVHDLYYVPRRCGGRETATARDEFAATESLTGRGVVDAARAQRLRRTYEDAARCFDESLAPLFASIDAMPGPTITIITSDHGEQFGEHSLFLHGNSLYPELVHVPLAVVGSGIAPREVSAPVSLTEIHDLVLNTATSGRQPSLLADMIAGRPAAPVPTMSFLIEQRMAPVKHPVGAVFDGRFEMIARRSGMQELYDLTVDPKTSHNLAFDKAYTADRLRLLSLLNAANTGTISAKLRRERIRKLRSLGYLN